MYGTETAPSNTYSAEIGRARLIQRQCWALFGLILPLLVLGADVNADEQIANVASLGQALKEGGRVLPRFHLMDGQSVIGRVIGADKKTLTIRRPTGGLRTVAHADIRSIEIANSDGKLVRGWLAPLEDGTTGWTTSDPSLAKSTDVASRTASESLTKSGGPLIKLPAVQTGTKKNQSFESESIDRAENGNVADQRRTQSGAVDGAQVAMLSPSDESGAALGSSETIHLNVRAEQVSESDNVVFFRLSLSAPPKESVAIIYSMLNGSAKADDDYKHRQGVLVFAPDEQEKALAVEIIDDDDIEDAETFQLFITADPNAVTIDTRTVEATIQDNDS